MKHDPKVFESKWVVDLQPDVKTKGKKKEELKGPFLLTISQNLQYLEYNPVSKSREPTLLPSDLTITGEELKAIISQFSESASLNIFISDGLNEVRYDLINSLSFEIGDRKSIGSKSSKQICIDNGQLWRDQNQRLFEDAKSHFTEFKIFYASKIMETELYTQILTEILQAYQNHETATGQFKILWDTVNSFAKKANQTLHCTILNNLEKGTPYYFKNQEISKEDLELKLLKTCVDYTLKELAIISWLAQITKACTLFYKKRAKKDPKHESSFEKQLNFGEFAPVLINKTLQLFAPNAPGLKPGHQTYKMKYVEFSSTLEVRDVSMKDEKTLMLIGEIVLLIYGFRIQLFKISPIVPSLFDALLVGINKRLAELISLNCDLISEYICRTQSFIFLPDSKKTLEHPKIALLEKDKPETVLEDMYDLLANFLINGTSYVIIAQMFTTHFIKCRNPEIINCIFTKTTELSNGTKPKCIPKIPEWSAHMFSTSPIMKSDSVPSVLRAIEDFKFGT